MDNHHHNHHHTTIEHLWFANVLTAVIDRCQDDRNHGRLAASLRGAAVHFVSYSFLGGEGGGQGGTF